MGFVYHGSSVGGLNILAPRISTHNKNYVYATRHREIAVVFLCKWNDFLLTLGSSGYGDKALPLTLVERYENAFEDIYSKKKGYIYILEDEDFFNDPRIDANELVSEREVKPIYCEEIDDVFKEIRELSANGKIGLCYYPDRPKNIPKNDIDLARKAVEIYNLNGHLNIAVYCVERFPHLKNMVYNEFNKASVDLTEYEAWKALKIK